MTEAKHTPGPWLAISNNRDAINIFERGERIGSVEGIGMRAEANASLVAAAPDLLEIVQRIAEGERSDDGHTALREAARAAIAKATGTNV